MKCPKCKNENFEKLYYDQDGDIFGCDDCVVEKSYEDVEDEAENEAYWNEVNNAEDMAMEESWGLL